MTKLVALVSLLLFLVAGIFSSCGNVRELQYFQGAFDTTKLSQITYPSPLSRRMIWSVSSFIVMIHGRLPIIICLRLQQLQAPAV